MRYLYCLFAPAALLLLASCNNQTAEGPAAASTARKVRLEVASFVPSSVAVLGEQILHVAEEAERVSGGSIELEVFDPNALVGAMEILDAVSAGKVDAGYGTPGFWMGKIPAAPIFSSVPFGPDTSEFLAWLYHDDGMKLYQEMYDTYGFNVKVLVCSMIPPETSGWFSSKIESPEDLRDLKMRFFGLGGRVMEKLGVSVSVLPGGEIFQALEKGVIDATEYALPTVDESQGFYKLVRYNYFPGWHQQSTAFELIVNKDAWSRLSPTQQAQLEAVCRSSVVHSIAYSEATQAAAMRRNEERGVTNMEWSPEMLAQFRAAWQEVVEEQADADPFFRKAWQDLQAFREDYALWGEKAYLRNFD